MEIYRSGLPLHTPRLRNWAVAQNTNRPLPLSPPNIIPFYIPVQYGPGGRRPPDKRRSSSRTREAAGRRWLKEGCVPDALRPGWLPLNQTSIPISLMESFCVNRFIFPPKMIELIEFLLQVTWLITESFCFHRVGESVDCLLLTGMIQFNWLKKMTLKRNGNKLTQIQQRKFQRMSLTGRCESARPTFLKTQNKLNVLTFPKKNKIVGQTVQK